ncbi:MAG: D-alanyl-D-alanine carboxypeptidase [Burkholderiaceae bacterium]|nr:D-alanyl-D-alanine carboxypeptidase [Microbacteriaceae bacterium]
MGGTNGGSALPTHDQSQDDFAELAAMMRRGTAPVDPSSVVDSELRHVRRRRGLIIAATVVVVALAAGGSYVGWALTAPLGAPVLTMREATEVAVPAAAVTAIPGDGASAISIVGADDYLGESASGIWATGGTDDPRSIASITKLITALVILEERPLAGADDPGPTITFDKADHDLYDDYYVLGATVAAMPTGSSLSQHDALATMLIPSASNYAEAVSTWAFGSQGAFLGATRQWLAANGLTGTTIVEPSGISARNTSTPTDLIAIGRLAAANPAIAKIAATGSLSLPGLGSMSNTNTLLGGRITGLKTGNLGQGTHNLLYTATLDVGVGQPLSVTGVVLGGHSGRTVGASVVALLDSIEAGFHEVPVSTSGEEVGTFSTAWGSTARVIVAVDASILTWSDSPVTTTLQTTTPSAYRSGEIVGTLTFTAGPTVVTADVAIDGDIDPPTAWWRLTHPAELGAR